MRKALAIRALGYANAVGQKRISEKLLLELIELADQPIEVARWAEELGGVYWQMAQSGLAKKLNLMRARNMYGVAVEHLDSVEGDRSPDGYDRLILALKDRGEVSDDIYTLSKDRQDLVSAGADYRRGGQELKRLSALAADPSAKDFGGGHGGSIRTYQAILERLERLGYDADYFAFRELLVCATPQDDVRAGELLPMLMESPGSDVNRDSNVLAYARARYGIKRYPDFVEFWSERAAVEEIATGFFKASQQSDFPAATKLMAPGSPMSEIEQEVFEKQSAQLNGAYAKDPARLLQIGETFVDGDWAAVRGVAPINHPERCMFAALKKVDGDWKVYDGDEYRFQQPLKAALEKLIEGR
jgi:hypothetical protein